MVGVTAELISCSPASPFIAASGQAGHAPGHARPVLWPSGRFLRTAHKRRVVAPSHGCLPDAAPRSSGAAPGTGQRGYAPVRAHTVLRETERCRRTSHSGGVVGSSL